MNIRFTTLRNKMLGGGFSLVSILLISTFLILFFMGLITDPGFNRAVQIGAYGYLFFSVLTLWFSVNGIEEITLKENVVSYQKKFFGKKSITFHYDDIQNLEMDQFNLSFYIVLKNGVKLKMKSDLRIELDSLSQELKQEFRQLDVGHPYKSQRYLYEKLTQRIEFLSK